MDRTYIVHTSYIHHTYIVHTLYGMWYVTLEVGSGRSGSTCQAGSCALAGYSILGRAGRDGLQPTGWPG